MINSNSKIKISPSILSADFGNLNADIKSIEDYVDWIHVDVMDGRFVPNITIGAPVVRCLQSSKLLDCHLMIQEPLKYINDFIKAKAGTISTHIELGEDSVYKSIEMTKQAKIFSGVAINPHTDIKMIFPFLDLVDFVLIMSVEPGFGGQSFMSVALDKIKTIRQLKPNLDIQVDGGINAETAKLAIQAGATNLVAGSYIFGANNRLKAINMLTYLSI